VLIMVQKVSLQEQVSPKEVNLGLHSAGRDSLVEARSAWVRSFVTITAFWYSHLSCSKLAAFMVHSLAASRLLSI
jgi:hypothetical protein